MQPTVNKRYTPPVPQWIPIVRNGRALFRFDPKRGIIEFNQRGEWHNIDLASEIERHEKQQVEQMEMA